MITILIDNIKQDIPFTNLTVTQALTAIADNFKLTAPAAMQNLLPIDGKIVILWKGELIFTGHIEVKNIDISSHRRDVSISGRSIAGDLVDSQFVLENSWVSGTRVDQILTDILRPFKIDFSPDNNQSFHNSPDFEVQGGEGIFTALDRLARGFGMFFTSAPDGTISAFKPSANKLPVFTAKLGKNIISLNVQINHSKIFNPLIGVKEGDVLENETYKNSAISRHRPLLVPVDDGLEILTRLKFEAAEQRRGGFLINMTIGDIVILPLASIIHIEAGDVDISGSYATQTQSMIFDNEGGNRTQFALINPKNLLRD